MKLDAVRFSVGPWEGRYSSVWRIWSNPEGVYLGVRTLLDYLKVSLHRSGLCRVAFTSKYNDRMIRDGRDPTLDRAFMKWNKGPVSTTEILQGLDIHFPLAALSLRERPSARKLCFIQPDEPSLRDNDSVTVKILFHKMHPDEPRFEVFLRHKGVMPAFWLELTWQEYLTVAFQYSQQLPLTVTKDQETGYATLLHEYFTKKGMQVGDGVDDLTIQVFQMGSPPAIYEMGRTSARWEEDRRFSIGTTM